MSQARAVAHSNIALAKYWGKADVAANLPAVPSLSLTLDGLTTRTEVCFDEALRDDAFWLSGAEQGGQPLARLGALLDRVRAESGERRRARVRSTNDFPTAAGLASSASGFAALALAARAAAGLPPDVGATSALARRSSASAARSLFGGFAALAAGGERGEPVAGAEHWPEVRLLVVVTARGPKAIGSTEGMLHTARTSPYYAPWVAHAPAVFERVRRAVLERDLEALGAAAEHSALAMHASMLAADPAVVYFQPLTLAVLARVRELRAGGVPAWCTMDAGPHVKVLTEAPTVPALLGALGEVPGVERILACGPGPAAYLVPAGEPEPRGAAGSPA